MKYGCSGQLRLSLLFEEANMQAFRSPVGPFLDEQAAADGTLDSLRPPDYADMLKLFALPVACCMQSDETMPKKAERTCCS